MTLFELILWNTPPLDLISLFGKRGEELRGKYFPELPPETSKQRISIFLDNIVLVFIAGILFQAVRSPLTLLIPLIIVSVFLISLTLAKNGLLSPKEMRNLPIGKLSLLLAISTYRSLWYFNLGLLLGTALRLEWTIK